MSTDREKIDAQTRIYLSAKHAIGPTELEILFKQRDKLAALSQTAPSAQEGVREAVTKALDFMVNNGSYTMTLEGRIALKEAHLIEQFGTASKQALSATPSASPNDAALLKQAHAVHTMMLRGEVAKLTPEQVAHLYSDQECAEIVAAIQAQRPTATPSVSALGEADKLALQALQEVEWRGTAGYRHERAGIALTADERNDLYFCPVCTAHDPDSDQLKHDSDCVVGRALAALADTAGKKGKA